jgi:hypothetical protein
MRQGQKLTIAAAVAALFLAGTARAEDCKASTFKSAAEANAQSVTTYHGPVFAVVENGWQTYVLQIQSLIDTACSVETEGFAARVAAFQAGHSLPASGKVDGPTLAAFRAQWQMKRTLYKAASRQPCPFTGRDDLVRIDPADDLAANDPRLASEAYAAWKRMRAAAIADGVITANSDLLKFVAAYRSPQRAAELVRRNPNRTAQGLCSVHISGFAADLNVGHAPGYDAISSAAPNRLYQSQQPIYQWLVANASRFGFVNYVFEPWHWEYVLSPGPAGR